MFADNLSNDSKTISVDDLEMAQPADVRLKVGVIKSEGNWDPAINGFDNLIKTDYGSNALEKIPGGNVNYTGGTSGRFRWKNGNQFSVQIENEGRYFNSGLVQYKEGFGASSVMYDFYEIDLK